MSLVSASSVIGGIKEYTFRGIQQFPIVLASTSLLFTIASGSVAHANLAAGLIFVIPFYTWGLQNIIGTVLSWSPSMKMNPSWKRNTGDSCNILKSNERLSIGSLDVSSTASVPSFWLMSMGFFIGYAISNAVDSLNTPSETNANSINIEKRRSHSIYVIVASCVFFLALLFVRFRLASTCEGIGILGWILSFFAAFGAAAIGFGMYSFSRKCGSRASDLFGILSQILPTSAMSRNPVVCTAEQT